jgi:hypothetical protein
MRCNLVNFQFNAISSIFIGEILDNCEFSIVGCIAETLKAHKVLIPESDHCKELQSLNFDVLMMFDVYVELEAGANCGSLLRNPGISIAARPAAHFHCRKGRYNSSGGSCLLLTGRGRYIGV